MSSPTSPQETVLAAAVELGWRLAELYALVDDTGKPTDDTLLPAHASLDPADQLELQVRAAAGDARRAGIAGNAASLEELVPCARKAHESSSNAEEFRRHLRVCHIEIQKQLWAGDEAVGKAYELGNGLSDTYGRVCRAYRGADCDRSLIWTKVFERHRIDRLKLLLDDLESRLDSSGVTVVKEHLDAYLQEVPTRLKTNGVPQSVTQFSAGLRRQTITWRQLLSGEKQPEAYLGPNARIDVRTEMRKMLWRRWWPWMLLLCAGLFGVAISIHFVIELYKKDDSYKGIASAITAVIGALGITKASMAVAIRSRLHQWSELVWNRALAARITQSTLFLDEVLRPVKPARRERVAMAAAKVRQRAPEVTPAPELARP
jgi:hypothetical protein